MTDKNPEPSLAARLRSVVAAFPATGKTYFAQRRPDVSDSDSSSFSWASPGERHPEWPGNYIEHIIDLANSGETVLVSTHAEVRDALKAARFPFALVYPSEDQRDDYIDRMTRRGSSQKLVTFVAGQWDEMIASCREQTRCEHIVLRPGQYLSDVIA